MKFMSQKKNSGFSLVELMVVVAIIGVLAALAIPRFQSFQAKARQSEAKNNLSHLYTLQESYYGDYERYVAITNAIGANLGNRTTSSCAGTNNIGFTINPCTGNKVRYSYTATVNGTGSTFVGRAQTGVNDANRVFPRCATRDVWTIDQLKVLTNVAPMAIAACR